LFPGSPLVDHQGFPGWYQHGLPCRLSGCKETDQDGYNERCCDFPGIEKQIIPLDPHKEMGDGGTHTFKELLYEKGTQRHGQEPADNSEKGAFGQEEQEDKAGGCSQRTHDGQFRTPCFGVKSDQTVDEEHPDKQRHKTEDGKVELVGADHGFAAFLRLGGTLQGNAGRERQADGCQVRIRDAGSQYEVDAVHHSEIAGEFLKGGDIGHGDLPTIHKGEPFRSEGAEGVESHPLPQVLDDQRSAFLEIEAASKPVSHKKGSGLRHQIRPTHWGRSGRRAYLPGAKGSIQNGVNADEHEHGVGSFCCSCIGCHDGRSMEDGRVFQELRNKCLRNASSTGYDSPVGLARDAFHAATEGMNRGRDGKTDAGEDGGAESNPEKNSQHLPEVEAHVTKGEPDPKAKDQSYGWHLLSARAPSLMRSSIVA